MSHYYYINIVYYVYKRDIMLSVGDRAVAVRRFRWEGWENQGGESHEWNSASDLQRYVTQFGTLSWIKPFSQPHCIFHSFILPIFLILYNILFIFGPFFTVSLSFVLLRQQLRESFNTVNTGLTYTVCMTSHVVRGCHYDGENIE